LFLPFCCQRAIPSVWFMVAVNEPEADQKGRETEGKVLIQAKGENP